MTVKENEIALHTHIESRKHKVTEQQKTIENTLSISSAHEFSDSMHSRETDAENGYDWYFIRQMPKLNGEPGYDTHWARTRQNVNGESRYVGEGNVFHSDAPFQQCVTVIKSTVGSAYPRSLTVLHPWTFERTNTKISLVYSAP